jgi:hypothetical protein
MDLVLYILMSYTWMFNYFINKGLFFQVNHGPRPIIKKFKMNYKGYFFPFNN